MKVLYDHQIFEAQKFGGISRYFFELIKNFSEEELLQWACTIKYSNNEYLHQLPFFKTDLLPLTEKYDPIDDFWKGKSFRGKTLLYKIKTSIKPEKQQIDKREANKAFSIEKIKEKDYDVLHPTFYDEYILDFIEDKPFVLTVFDMIYEIFPELFYQHQSDKTKRLVQQANRIIAISHSTKNDIVNIFGIPEEKISVIHLANSLVPDNSIVENDFKAAVPEKFFLFIGQRGGYKNFMFFAQMFATFVSKQPGFHVICTGAAFNAKEKAFLKDLNIENAVQHVFVNDAQLIHLYQHAIALVFPSMYEGFGLPILEAFSTGCPVIVSKGSSLEEIGDDAVIYFEPKNPASLLYALEQAVHNSQLRQDKVDKGFVRLKDFSWEKTAKETKEVYESIFKR